MSRHRTARFSAGAAGTLIAGIGGEPGEFTRVLAGDGGWLVFDPADEEHAFGSSPDIEISRHRAGEPWAFGVNVGAWKGVSPKIEDEDEKKQRAMAVVEIEPGRGKGTRKVWVGTNRLWRTDNDGEEWKPVSPYFDGSAISAIEISNANPRVMFVGTTDGGIFRSTDGGKNWSENLAGLDIPARLITHVETHPKKARIVAVTVASSGAPGAGLRRINKDDTVTPIERFYSHVFLSSDMGNTWTDIDGGRLPNVLYNALAYETHAPYRLFVGGDAGVWAYVENDWISITANMPNVMVSDLVFHHNDRILTAATYGRGIWRLPITGPFNVIPAGAPASETPLAIGLIEDPDVAAPELLEPPDGAVFNIFPRETHLTWTAVPGAIAYSVEINFMAGRMLRSSQKPNLTFNFVGAQPGRWRVWAVLPDSLRSRASGWREFRYLR